MWCDVMWCDELSETVRRNNVVLESSERQINCPKSIIWSRYSYRICVRSYTFYSIEAQYAHNLNQKNPTQYLNSTFGILQSIIISVDICWVVSYSKSNRFRLGFYDIFHCKHFRNDRKMNPCLNFLHSEFV